MKIFKNWKSKKVLKLENEKLISENEKLESYLFKIRLENNSLYNELNYTRKQLNIIPIRIKKSLTMEEVESFSKQDFQIIKNIMLYSMTNYLKPYVFFETEFNERVPEYVIIGTLNIIGEKND